MKAMVLHSPAPIAERPLRFEDVDRPSPGVGEVLVRVSMCGVCRTDLHEVEGELPMQRPNVIPGHQIVGTVAKTGEGTSRFQVGERVGVAWLHETCCACYHCTGGCENLCTSARFTGWSVNGGYAEYMTVSEHFAYRIPNAFPDQEAAPLLCAGIIGYRALEASGVRPDRRVRRLGLYGFGAAAHIAIQVARHWGAEVYVFTRSEANRELARKLGAVWAGPSAPGAGDPRSSDKLHAAIIFAPAGPLVRDALEIMDKGGTLVLAGIYMSPIPELDYLEHLYDERVVRSVANATRRDGERLLKLAGEIPIRTSTQRFPLEHANEALLALKNSEIRGAGVLEVS
ncbi:MAG: zinc-dependent alcohol dehydrogenase family protein [Phycisphaerae bacterium]|jgi:propanol-preferring alcohol dehydrogenase